MATIKQTLLPEEAQFLGTSFPTFDKINGTNFPVSRLLYPDSDTAAFWTLEAVNYGSGNWTVDLIWYATPSAVTGTVRWGVSLAAITPESDSQDVETKALATEQTVDDAHLGTTAKRLHKATLALSNLDSVAAGDWCSLRVRRVGANGADTLSGSAALAQIRIAYADA